MTLSTYPLQPRSQSALWETLAPGVTREWHFDKRVVLFHLHTPQTGAVDRYYEAVEQTMATWSPNPLFLCLYDYSVLSVSAAPYSRQRLHDLMALSPALEGYGAVVVSALYACWAQTMYQAQPSDNRRYALFRTCDEGLGWLTQKLSRRAIEQAAASRPALALHQRRNREEPNGPLYQRLL